MYRDHSLVPETILQEVQQIRVHLYVPFPGGDVLQAGDIIELACGARMAIVREISHDQFRERVAGYPRWLNILDRNPEAVCFQVSFD